MSHFHLQISWNNLISAIHPDYQVADMFQYFICVKDEYL